MTDKKPGAEWARVNGAEAPPFAVEFVGVTKRFGKLVANDNVSFGIRKGSIHGIIGENGAGKSTLMSALFGLYKLDAGSIRLNGQSCDIKNPSTAIQSGIGMVHQHFMLVERMTPLQNIILGAEKGLWLERGTGRVEADVKALQTAYGLDFPLHQMTRDLPLGVQQRIEILKALYRGAEVLILDEPTGVLTPGEVRVLFKVFRDLAAQGKTVVLITHKLQEIIELTDTVTVLRQGRCIGTVRTADTDRLALATMMVGRRPTTPPKIREAIRPEVQVSVENLKVCDKAGTPRVFGLSFDVHAGEVLGIAGVSGNGQSELVSAMAALTRPADGTIRLGGVQISSARRTTPAEIRKAGVGHIPEDRHRLGIIKRWTAAENSVLGLQNNDGVDGLGWRIRRAKVVEWCRQLMAAHDVRPAEPASRIGLFSGGNQQKLVIGRELALSPDILLVSQPTRGVDLGAIEAIHAALLAERDKGKSILLVSVELEEIFALSDRILVMFEGRSMGIVLRSEADEDLIGLMMAGLPLQDARAELAGKGEIYAQG